MQVRSFIHDDMHIFEHWPFIINCGGAVSLVFVNKHLMNACAFHFLGFLGALHVSITAAFAVYQSETVTKASDSIPPIEVALYLLLSLASLITMNLSLMVNHVGIYQISKIAMIPTCCFFEFVSQGKRISKRAALAIAVLIIGVITACALFHFA